MKINIDLGSLLLKILAGIFLAGSTFAVGALVEFQGVKAKVNKHEGQLSVVSQIVCKYAIRDRLEDAETICSAVIAK